MRIYDGVKGVKVHLAIIVWSKDATVGDETTDGNRLHPVHDSELSRNFVSGIHAELGVTRSGRDTLLSQ